MPPKNSHHRDKPPMPPKNSHHRDKRTGWYIWCLGVICTIITVVVIIAGIVIFVGYLVIHPKEPSITVTYTHLDVFNFDYAGILSTRVIIHIKWVNNNARAHVDFKPASFVLGLREIQIAELRSDELEVSKKSSKELEYVVESNPIPLSPREMAVVDGYLKRDEVVFELKGMQKTRWRVWFLGSLSFWLRLDCQLHFVPSSLSSTGTNCSSKPK